MRKRKRSGQVLVVTILAISLTILTIQMYLFTLNTRHINLKYDILSDYLISIQRGTEHVASASIAHISQGGENSILTINLNRWKYLTSKDYRFGYVHVNTTMYNGVLYNEGVWLDWGTSGTGYSSIAFTAEICIEGRDLEVNLSTKYNVTTKIVASGSYIDLGGDSKQMEVVVNLYSDNSPALPGSITVQYNKTTAFVKASTLGDYMETDYGNGTKKYTFTDDIIKTGVPLRLEVKDRRDIFVQTELLAEEA